ncbi:MAG: hypothetical protein EOO91_01980 [Pedobacter sp.]|nr:MAG: hypothetical protein EOO91_01980 [Pedobacter sp.]
MNKHRKLDKDEFALTSTKPKDIADPNRFGFFIWAFKDLLKTGRFADFYKEVKNIYLKNNRLIPQEDSDVDLNGK